MYAIRSYYAQPQTPPVPAEDCFETGGRLTPQGEVIEPLEEPELAALARRVADSGARAVAINLLYSYLDDRFERAIEAAMPEGCFVSSYNFV